MIPQCELSPTRMRMEHVFVKGVCECSAVEPVKSKPITLPPRTLTAGQVTRVPRGASGSEVLGYTMPTLVNRGERPRGHAGPPTKRTINEDLRQRIIDAIKTTPNATAAAKIIGVSEPTLYNYAKKLKINFSEHRRAPVPKPYTPKVSDRDPYLPPTPQELTPPERVTVTVSGDAFESIKAGMREKTASITLPNPATFERVEKDFAELARPERHKVPLAERLANARGFVRQLEMLDLALQVQARIPERYLISADALIEDESEAADVKRRVAVAALLFWDEAMRGREGNAVLEQHHAAHPTRDVGDEACQAAEAVAEAILGRPSERAWIKKALTEQPPGQ